jgi:uncharacterized protein YjaZ
MKNIDLHVLNKGKTLDPFLDAINKSFEEGIQRIQLVLPVDNVDIVIEDCAWRTIPETGVGGDVANPFLIHIQIDLNYPDRVKNLDFEIRSTLAHELHHCARWREQPAYGTLLDHLVTDGLADHFDIEINGGEPRLHDTILSQKQIKHFLELARPEFNNANYDSYTWFFGDKERQMPRWTGYSLGFHIIDEYLKEHPEMTSAKLYKTPAREFIKIAYS